MIFADTSLPLTARIMRRSTKEMVPISGVWLVIMIVPMVIDGINHAISDRAAIGQGFRYSNAWFAALTDYNLPESFNHADALGSFISWARLINGFLFGAGTMTHMYPYLSALFENPDPAKATTIRTRDDHV